MSEYQLSINQLLYTHELKYNKLFELSGSVSQLCTT